MHIGQYVFAQITQFLPQRQFRRFVAKYDDHTRDWALSHWSQLLVLMFGQFQGCRGLRELTDITLAHGRKTFFLGFGRQPVNRQMLSRANSLRDYRIFEEFAFHMVTIAQRKRITKVIQNSKKLIYREFATNFSSCVKTFIIYDFLRLLKPEA